MIEWVDERCTDWSDQYRKRACGVIGYPPASQLFEFKYIHSPEGLTDKAQEVSRAVGRMQVTKEIEATAAVFIAHYLFAGSAKVKAASLGITLASYWRNLNNAQAYISGGITYPWGMES